MTPNEKQNPKFNRSISSSGFGLATIKHHSTSNVVEIHVKPNEQNSAYGATVQVLWLDIDELEDLMGLMNKIKQEGGE